jgi:hypothetical protein
MRARDKTLGAALLLHLMTLPSARALVQGDGPQKADCYAEWQVTTPDLGPTRGRINVDCTDGDPTCDADGVADGRCTFAVSICAFQANVPQCTPQPVTEIKLPKKTRDLGLQVPPLPATAALCGPATPIFAPIRINKKGAQQPSKPVKLKMTAISSGKPRKDADGLNLKCLPSPVVATCAANTIGPDEPNELRLTVPAAGTDLDNGRSGPSHNFPVPEATRLQFCLQGCDARTTPICNTSLLTGPGTFNDTAFGAPLPLIAAGVPVCVVNRFAAMQQPGTADLSTGDIAALVRLESDVWLTDSTAVCPRCETGTCSGGPNQGKPCAIDGIVVVSGAQVANKTFRLSKDCPPPNNVLAGTLSINLPLTTGRSALVPQPGGSLATPCVRQPGDPAGLTPLPDTCPAGGTCTGSCTGDACVNAAGVDYVSGAPTCVDAKGGLSQLCCSSRSDLPCFPTGPGSIGVVTRQGKALPPQPPWPTATYPKTTDCTPGQCSVLVGAFCEAATGSATVDGLTGLPGPGAIILPVATEWLTSRGGGTP